jgi:hypothetical protein
MLRIKRIDALDTDDGVFYIDEVVDIEIGVRPHTTWHRGKIKMIDTLKLLIDKSTQYNAVAKEIAYSDIWKMRRVNSDPDQTK